MLSGTLSPAADADVETRVSALIEKMTLAEMAGNANADFVLAFHYYLTGDGVRAADMLAEADDGDEAVVLLRDAARERGTRIADPEAQAE